MSKVQYAPLSSGFMAVSIIGFFVSIWLIMDWSETWGFTFTLFFIIMFVASIISMTKAEPIPEHLDTLAIHETHKLRKPMLPREKKHHEMHEIFKWYDPFFLALVILSFYFLLQASTYSKAPVSPAVFIIVLAIFIIVLIWMVVEVLSSTRLSPIKQAGFVILLLITGPLGMLIYYVYRRLKS